MSGLTAPWFIQTFYDASGKPLAGGKVYFYVAGSTTLPKTIYSDYELTNPVSQPLVLDASGVAQQYYMESGGYKIAVYTSINGLVRTRDNVFGVGSGSGTGSDDHKVLATSSDAVPDYLASKLANTATVSWSVDASGSSQTMQASVVADQVLDGKVKADSADTAGYLDDKLTTASNITFPVVGGKVVLPFDEYMKLTGGTFTGPVTYTLASGDKVTFHNAYGSIPSYRDFVIQNVSAQHLGIGTTGVPNIIDIYGAPGAESVTITTGLTVYGPVTLNNPTITAIAGSTGLVTTDGTGTLQVTPWDLGKLKTSVSDAVPEYLSTKLQAGDGLTITTTVDDVQGEVMHLATTPVSPYYTKMLSKSINLNLTLTTTPQTIYTSPEYGAGRTVTLDQLSPGYMYHIVYRNYNVTAACTVSLYNNGTVVPNTALTCSTGNVEFEWYLILVDAVGGPNSLFNVLGNVVSTGSTGAVYTGTLSSTITHIPTNTNMRLDVRGSVSAGTLLVQGGIIIMEAI